MTGSSGNSEQITGFSARRYRRAGDAVLPFFPYGLVPVLGLLALLLIGWTILSYGVIQATARNSAEKALVEAGEDWATVRASGQWIRLTGTPPSPEAASRAVEAVRKVRSSTWLGNARPITRVSTRFDTAEATQLSEAPTQVEEPEVLTPQYLFRLTAGRLTLDGRVPTETLRQTIGALAESHISPPDIAETVNRLAIADGDAPYGFEAVANRGIKGLALCHSGTASFIDSVFNFRCEAPDTDVDTILSIVRAGLPLGTFGHVEVLPSGAVASCEEELADLLEAAKIEFSTGSALINIASGPVLDLAASAASDCPGTLRVEGHTDSTGNAALNEALSLRRAEAVRNAMIERGVSADRLIATGFGASRPTADNDTQSGRARNRRIEIRIVRPDE